MTLFIIRPPLSVLRPKDARADTLRTQGTHNANLAIAMNDLLMVPSKTLDRVVRALRAGRYQG